MPVTQVAAPSQGLIYSMLADGIIASLLTGSSFSLNYFSFVRCLLLLNIFIV